MSKPSVKGQTIILSFYSCRDRLIESMLHGYRLVEGNGPKLPCHLTPRCAAGKWRQVTQRKCDTDTVGERICSFSVSVLVRTQKQESPMTNFINLKIIQNGQNVLLPFSKPLQKEVHRQWLPVNGLVRQQLQWALSLLGCLHKALKGKTRKLCGDSASRHFLKRTECISFFPD